MWTQSIGPGGNTYDQPVLPDGCVDIVWIGDRATLVSGPATAAAINHLPAETLIVGARLRPGLAGDILGVRACELLNRDVPFADFVKLQIAGDLIDPREGSIASFRAWPVNCSDMD